MYGEITQETIDLKHGIKLDLLGYEGKITVYDIAEFLSKALHHFRDLKAQDVATSSDGYCATAFLGGASMMLYSLQAQTVDHWLDAASDAYTSASTLEDIRLELPQYREANQNRDNWLTEVCQLLEKPSGHMRAMAVRMKAKVE